MSTPSVIVLPVSGDATQQPDRDTTQVASTIQHALHERAHPEPEHPGPFKQIIAHQDRLYKYINWNDPIRTLGSYVGVLSLLFGAHYLPLTQMALKGGVTALGLVSVVEFASRTLGQRSLSAQLRPKEYRKIPESALNATLKDIHDFVQYAVVQVQRIVFGQDLQNTFAAFLGLTALYWLVIAVSPFWLTVVALTSVYAAPLVASARGRKTAREAGARVQELATTATENGRVVAHDASVGVQRLASTATTTGRETAQDASVGVQRLASTATKTGRETAHDASVGVESLINSTTETSRTAANTTTAGAQNLANTITQGNILPQAGKDKAADLSKQAKSTFSHVSGATAENIRQAQQLGTNAAHATSNAAGSARTNAREYISGSAPSNTDTGSERAFDRDQTAPRGASGRVPDASHSQTTHPAYVRQQPSVVPSKPVYTSASGAGTGADAHLGALYTTAGDRASQHSVLERPRGAAYPVRNEGL